MKQFCLTIAGADPTSSAGIQADIRTFDRCGIHAFSVITAVTSQTTKEFFEFKTLSDMLDSQLNAILSHYPVNHVKVGMIPDVDALDIIIKYILKYKLSVIYDPVTISSAGKRLSLEGLEQEIESKLFPIVRIITPNLSEASIYSGIDLSDVSFSDTLLLRKACDILLSKLYTGSRKSNQEKAVIVKNALSTRETIMDFSLVNKTTEKGLEKQFRKWEKPKVRFMGNVHGTGCVFSSALTAYLSLDNGIEESIYLAETFFDEKFLKFVELPDEGKILDLTEPEDRRKVIDQVKEVYNHISKDKRFAKIIPEVRLNISCSLPQAESREDIAGIEGRVTIINGFPQACGEIRFGVSDHTARLILAAKEFDNSINLAINLKYKDKYITSIQENTKLFTYEFVRVSQPDEIREKEHSTMQWLIKESVERTGKVPEIVWDKGAIGKEPIIRVFAENSQDLISKLNIIISVID